MDISVTLISASPHAHIFIRYEQSINPKKCFVKGFFVAKTL